MGTYEQQIKANAQAIQEILTNSKNFEELTAFAPAGEGETLIITIRNIVTDITYKITEQQLATIIINYLPVDVWRWIEGSDVKKGDGKTNLTTVEATDTVKFKPLTNGGFPVTVPFGVYDAGEVGGLDKQLVGSYTMPVLVT